MYKKILSFLIVLTLAASSFICVPGWAEEAVADAAAAAEESPDGGDAAANDVEEQAPLEEVDDKKYSNAINMLSRFGVLDEAGFDKNEAVTRESFASAAVRLMDMKNLAACDTVFDDVKSDNIHSGAIDALYKMGIISASGDGKFNPQNQIKKVEAAKMLESILGYDVKAQAVGGYPAGYLSLASQHGLFKNISVSEAAPFSWGECAQMIYNALDVDLFKHFAYPDGQFQQKKGRNMLTEYLHIQCITGIVTASDVTSLTDDKPLGAGYVQIGDKRFKDKDTGAEKLLGCKVNGYFLADTDDGEYTLLAVKTLNGYTELEVEIKNITEDSTNTELCYYTEKNRLEKIDLTDTVVLYNGMRHDKAASIVYPTVGGVKLLDDNGDSDYETMIIEKYDIYVVDKVSASSGEITDQFSMPDLKLDINDPGAHIVVERNGEPYDFEKIEKGNVLSVAKSDDGRYVKIYVSSKRIRDVVQEITEDGIKIYDEFFPIAANQEEFNKLSVGEKVIVYFTHDEKAAGYGSNSIPGEMYAYAYAGRYEMKGIAAGEYAEFLVYTDAGVLAKYKTSENIRMNGERISKHTKSEKGKYLIDNYFTKYDAVLDRDVFDHQLVKISIDDKSQIVSIDKFYDNRIQNGGDGHFNENFSVDYSFYTDDPCYNSDQRGTAGAYPYAYYNSYGMIQNKYIVKNAMGINAPAEESFTLYNQGELSSYDMGRLFSTFTPSGAWKDHMRIFKFDLFDVDDSGSAALILQRPHQSGSNENAPATEEEFFIVDKMTTGLNAEGSPVRMLHGLTGGKAVSYAMDEDAVAFEKYAYVRPYSLSQGDVLRIALNPAGEVCNLQKLFTYEPDTYSYLYLLRGNRFNDYEAKQDPKTKPVEQGYPVKNRFGNLGDGFKLADNANMETSQRVMHARFKDVVDGYYGVVDFGPGGPADTVLCIGLSSCKIYVYDVKAEKVRVGSVADIEPANSGQTAVIRNRYSVGYDVLLINRPEAFPENPDDSLWIGNSY